MSSPHRTGLDDCVLPHTTHLYYGFLLCSTGLDLGVFPHSTGLQCSKLRVHPAPDVHIFWARAQILGHVHPSGACFFNILNITIQNELMDIEPGACF